MNDEMDDWVSVFFKQKTAYDIQYGLVGSEMCIRDRVSESDTINNEIMNEQIRKWLTE